MKITRNNPQSDKIQPTQDQRFEVIDLECVWCSGKTFADPFSVSREEPNGWLWYCEKCGEVDEDGHPIELRDDKGKLIFGEETPTPKNRRKKFKPSPDEVPF